MFQMNIKKFKRFTNNIRQFNVNIEQNGYIN